MLPYLLAATLPSWLRCLQPASRSLELYASVPPRRDTYSAPPGALHTTTSLHLHRAFRPPYLQAYPLLHLQHASRAPKLSTILLCLHDYGASPTLHASTSLHDQRPSNASYLHFATRATYLQRSNASYLHVRGGRSKNLQRDTFCVIYTQGSPAQRTC